MTVTTCKDCKHWTCADVDTYGKPQGWGLCGFIPMLDRTTTYDPEACREVLTEDYKDLKAAVMDGSSYRADLYTAPEFFCYHGEAK